MVTKGWQMNEEWRGCFGEQTEPSNQHYTTLHKASIGYLLLWPPVTSSGGGVETLFGLKVKLECSSQKWSYKFGQPSRPSVQLI